MSHVMEHCDLPKITRHWKRLGEGATYTCECNRQYRLTWIGAHDTAWASWKEIK